MRKLIAIGLSFLLPGVAISQDINAVVVDIAAKTSKSADLTISKWQGEVNFQLKPDLSAISASDISVENISQKTKLTTPEVDYQYYELPIDTTNPEGGFEFEIDLKVKPHTNIISIPFISSNIDFFKQSGLNFSEESKLHTEIVSCTETDCYDKDGKVVVHCPENVIDSYAIYSSQQKINREGGKLYKTGKMGHIFRPKIIDSSGKEVWGGLNIDKEFGMLSITIPQSFLDEATYPVIIDPEIGYHTNGAKEAYYINQIRGNIYTMTENGTLTTISAYIRAYNSFYYSNTSAAVYSYNPNSPYVLTRVANSGDIYLNSATLAWWDYSGFSSALTSGTQYSFVWNQANYSYLAYDDITVTNGGDVGQTYGTWPDSWNAQTVVRQHSIYATYTTGGAGAVPARRRIIITE